MRSLAAPLATGQEGSALIRRLAGGTAANFIDKAAILLVQTLSIPVLTHHWGADGYGLWLMVMAVPTYVALSDVGLTSVAGVEMTRCIALGNRRAALEAFQSVWAFVTTLVLALTIAIGLIAVACAGRIGWPLACSICLVGLYGAVSVQMNLLTGVFRATQKYGTATLFGSALVLAEGGMLLILCLAGQGMTTAALAMLLMRLAGSVIFYHLLRQREPWFHLGIDHARLKTVQHLAHPSLAALSLTLANALALQGVMLTLGWAAGAASVAVFGAVRLISRLPLQLSGLLTRASLPELTHAQTVGNGNLVLRLLAANVVAATITTLPVLLALLLFGPGLIALVSGGHLLPSSPLVISLACAATLNALWQAAAGPLIAVNGQARFAYWYLFGSALVVLAPMLPAPDRALVVAIAMTLAEAMALVVVLMRLRAVLNGPGVQRRATP